MNTTPRDIARKSQLDLWRDRAKQNRDRIDYLSGKVHRLLGENKHLKQKMDDMDNQRAKADTQQQAARENRALRRQIDEKEQRIDFLEAVIVSDRTEINRLRDAYDSTVLRHAVDITDKEVS